MQQLYTFPNENFEYGYPHSNAFLQFLSQIGALQAAKRRHIIQLINDANYFRQYIPGYTVENFWPYPIRHCITKSSALEWQLKVWYFEITCLKSFWKQLFYSDQYVTNQFIIFYSF